jgi:hypothetical protein
MSIQDLRRISDLTSKINQLKNMNNNGAQYQINQYQLGDKNDLSLQNQTANRSFNLIRNHESNQSNSHVSKNVQLNKNMNNQYALNLASTNSIASLNNLNSFVSSNQVNDFLNSLINLNNKNATVDSKVPKHGKKRKEIKK